MSAQQRIFRDFDSWHHVTCRTHSITQCRPELEGGFRARFFGLELGAYGIAETSTSTAGTIRSQREACDIRKDQVDDVMVLLVLSGRADLEQDGRCLGATDGGMILYDQARPFSLELRGPHRLAAFSVARSAFDAALPGDRHQTAHVIGPASPVGAFATSTLAHFLSMSQTLPVDVVGRLAPSVLDIVATAFTMPDPAAGLQRSEDRLLVAAKAYIDRHLGEPLSVTILAEAVGVSPRALARLFAREATTPMRWIWERRLAMAHAGLRQGRFASVTEAAMQCGFVELSHFSRAFKAAFGRAPSNVGDRR